jgi:hypothetical protein
MATTPDKATPQKTITILVNNQPVEMHDREATGAEIKQAAGIPLAFKLYNTKGEEVADDQQVKLRPNEKFTAISGQDVS